MRDHGSIGLFLGSDLFLGGEFGSECLGLFLFFCFCLVRGEKVVSAQDFSWQSKGGDHFKSWFSFFSCLLVTILYCSDIVWSKDLSAYFFCFHLIFDPEFSFLFLLFLIGNFLSFCAFSHSFDGEFSFFFAFSHPLIENFPFLFSSEGQD